MKWVLCTDIFLSYLGVCRRPSRSQPTSPARSRSPWMTCSANVDWTHLRERVTYFTINTFHSRPHFVVRGHPRHTIAAAATATAPAAAAPTHAKQHNKSHLNYLFIALCLKFSNNFLIYSLLCSRVARPKRQIDVDWGGRPAPAAPRRDRRSPVVAHLMELQSLID